MRRQNALLLFAFCLLACTPAPPRGQGSVVIIAIPNFRADDLSCTSSGDSLTPQIDLICNESVRFTHAYTPSSLAIPALASIFTGLYPAEHGVHRNGASQYLQREKSLPEQASGAGYQTFFVSGGVPALRKTAISKGFIDFDDGIRLNGAYYRSATETLRKLTSFIETRSEATPFLGVVSLADLSFPEIVSYRTNREEGVNGKLQDIDEAIGEFRREFMRLKIWDSLTVVVVGLTGTEHAEHSGLSKGLSLYDEIVRVPLLIKPSRKPRDQGPSWKIDEPVTLADLGRTLSGVMDFKPPESRLPVIDFSESLDAKELTVGERPIFAESDLPAWRDWGPRLLSIRYGEWVQWLPPEPKLFNSYTDHLELRNLFTIDTGQVKALAEVFHPYVSQVSDPLAAGKFMAVSVAEKLRVAKVVFSNSTSAEEKLRSLVEIEIRRPEDWQILQWHVGLLVAEQNWAKLRDLLNTHLSERRPHTGDEVDELQLWQLFIRLKLKMKIPAGEFKNSPLAECLYIALALKRFSPTELDAFQGQQTCKDPETQAWVSSYLFARAKHNKEAGAFFDIARGLTDRRIEQTEFARAFWVDGATWDYSATLPDGPSPFELFLASEANPELAEYIKKKQFP